MIWGKSSHNLPCFIAWKDVDYCIKWRRLSHKMTQIILWFLLFNAVGVVPFRRNPPYILARDNVIHVMDWIFQRRRCCAFDSPGLPNDSAGYPGLVYVVWETTPSVLHFFGLIPHERFHYKRGFTEKAQHLQRWISLRTFTRGRLVPRQPRAIKRTTRTKLCDEGISIAKYIYWNIGITPTTLHHCNIHHGEYIHRNIGMISTASVINKKFFGLY